MKFLKTVFLALLYLGAAAGLTIADDGARSNQLETETVNSAGMRLVLVPVGEFLMGSSAEDLDKLSAADPKFNKARAADQQPQHQVRISSPFYMGACEVTKGQFAAFVAATGYESKIDEHCEIECLGWNESLGKYEVDKSVYSWRFTGFPYEDEHPVVNVSWIDAVAFCEWLSRTEGKSYRLPSEAEWEYACRAGTSSLFVCGDDVEELAEYANVADRSAHEKWTNYRHFSYIKADDGYAFIAPVGRYRPNAFGLFDMHGNAWEWCQDAYDALAYKRRGGVTVDPLVSAGGTELRVIRGGCCFNYARNTRSANRNRDPVTHRACDIGFRVVLVAGD